MRSTGSFRSGRRFGRQTERLSERMRSRPLARIYTANPSNRSESFPPCICRGRLPSLALVSTRPECRSRSHGSASDKTLVLSLGELCYNGTRIEPVSDTKWAVGRDLSTRCQGGHECSRLEDNAFYLKAADRLRDA